MSAKSKKNSSPQEAPAQQRGPATGDVHVLGFEALDPPDVVKGRFECTEEMLQTVRRGREEIRAALSGQDQRLVMIVGPCSVHDPAAAYQYAQKLGELRRRLAERLIIVMRVYFEKPRTNVGWKGLINDPYVDGTHDINSGLAMARELLVKINALPLPCASEFLDPIVPQYTADLVTWAAIGARTTESQTHREMASGLSMPVGFKNATDGSLQVALDAMVSARAQHVFLGIDGSGRTCIVRTSGNPDVHIVLRGSIHGPNYYPADIAYARVGVNAQPQARLIMVDCSHGNSGKDFRKQPHVFGEVLRQVRQGDRAILGMMLESNLESSRQDAGGELTFGQSITDACIDWPTTEQLLREAAG